MSKPVRVYQDCALCDIGKSAKIFMNGAWTTSTVLERRDTPQGMPRFETMNTIYTPDAHDGGDPLNLDYKDFHEKANKQPVSGRYLDDEFLCYYGADATAWGNY